MKVTGKIEVFVNNKGYLTGVLKSFNENKEVTGKTYIDVNAYGELHDTMDDKHTYTLNVKEGYLNARHVDIGEKSFDKIELSILDASVMSVYPEVKKAKKGGK